MEELDTSPASINELEHLILCQRYTEAESILTKLIQLYSKDKISFTLSPFDRSLTAEQSDLESYQVIEKLAFILTVWFSSEHYSPSKQFFSYIATQKHFIGSVFAASSYHSTDHIVGNLSLLGKANYTLEEIRRILFVFTIESDIELPWGTLLQHLPDESAQVFLGLISSIGIQLSKRAQKNISTLLDVVEILPTIKTNEIKNLSSVIKAYFNCSNLVEPNKYELKKWCVKSIQEYLATYLPVGIKKRMEKDVRKTISQSPTILVIHEAYGQHHAMYRCWHTQLVELKNGFNVVYMTLESNIDEISLEDCHSYEAIKDNIDINAQVKKVLKIKPDIILYPSLGMSFYAPFLANLRLAPIQVVCPGHPSSSYIPEIDYMYMPDIGITKEKLSTILTEKWLNAGKESTEMVARNVSIDVTDETDVVKIAINGVIQKVSQELISLCIRLSENTINKVEFHFYMASPKQGVELFAAKSILRRYLPNSVIHPFTNYHDYMSTLEKCRFALPTIPFGGTNSNIDLIHLEKPKLFLKTDGDIPENSDYHIWNDLGVTDGFCSNIKALEKKATEWIDDNSECKSIAIKISEAKLVKLQKSKKENFKDERLKNVLLDVIKHHKQ